LAAQTNGENHSKSYQAREVELLQRLEKIKGEIKHKFNNI